MKLKLEDRQLKAVTRFIAVKVADLIDLEVELLQPRGTSPPPPMPVEKSVDASPSDPSAGTQASTGLQTQVGETPKGFVPSARCREASPFFHDGSDMTPRWGFRGQPQTFKTLCPSYQRRFENVKSAATVEFIEEKLIEAFRTHYKKFSGSLANMPNPHEIGDKRDLRWLSVMQHYGVPTRLLDWTSNYWTSIYFASAGDPESDAELWFYDRELFQTRSRSIARTAGLDVSQYNLSEEDPPVRMKRSQPLLLEFNQPLTPRMREQEGYHTIASDVFVDHAPLMYRILSETEPEIPDGFFRIVISSACKDKTLKYLNEHLKISAGSVFPDFEGLGRFLRWQLDSLVTALL